MDINHAVIKRIREICHEQNTNVCDICLNGGMSPAAIYDLMHGRTKHPQINTIKRICMGANITLREFFEPDYFDSYEE